MHKGSLLHKIYCFLFYCFDIFCITVNPNPYRETLVSNSFYFFQIFYLLIYFIFFFLIFFSLVFSIWFVFYWHCYPYPLHLIGNNFSSFCFFLNHFNVFMILWFYFILFFYSCAKLTLRANSFLWKKKLFVQKFLRAKMSSCKVFLLEYLTRPKNKKLYLLNNLI